MWKGNVVRIYTGPDNRSHFEDLSLPLDAIMAEGRTFSPSVCFKIKVSVTLTPSAAHNKVHNVGRYRLGGS